MPKQPLTSVSITKEQLLARVQLMSRSDVLQHREDPVSVDHHLMVTEKLKELIHRGDVSSYLELESMYTFLVDRVVEDEGKMEDYVKEIRNFII